MECISIEHVKNVVSYFMMDARGILLHQFDDLLQYPVGLGHRAFLAFPLVYVMLQVLECQRAAHVSWCSSDMSVVRAGT